MLDGSFTDIGLSPAWYAGRSGFSIGLTMTGTNSVTIEQEIGGAWYTIGTAITATTARHYMPGVDYTPSARFRINCGTHDTDPITYVVQGDIFGANVTEDMGLPLEDSYMLENGVDSWLLESGSQWLMENA